MASIEKEYDALLQFLYLAPVGLVQTSIDGEIVLINPISAQLMMPLSRDGGLTNLFAALETVAPDLRHLCANFGKPHGMVCDAVRIQINAGVPGKSDPQILALTLLKLDANRLMVVLSDITLQVRRERQLKQSEAWFNAVLTGISDYALMKLDQKGCVETWNASIGRVTGFTDNAVFRQAYSIFSPPDTTTSDSLQDRLREADENGWSLDEGYRQRSDGTRFWASTMITPLHSNRVWPAQDPANGLPLEEPSYCLVIRDISDKREANETHRKAISCDHLTGVANRRAFFDAAELELERMKRSPRALSLIVFDVDYFKKVNDRFGHPAGDIVLRNFAATLTAAFRQVDVVARIGGEEFAVIMPSTDLATAQAAANRLRELVESKPVEVDGVKISYTVSGGVATMEDGMSGLDILMQRADQALYAAKACGRNCIRSSYRNELVQRHGAEVINDVK